jgi:hypothetical protein
MPYVFNPYTYSYVYYPEGSPPPKFDTSGEEYIPGFAESYAQSNPNSPYAQATEGMVSGDYGSNTGTIFGQTNPPIVSVHGGPSYDESVFGSSAAAPSATSTPAAGDVNNEQRNAYEYLSRTLEGWGLGTLAPKILEYIQQGYDADTIMLMIQDTPEYQQRFAGNELRKKAGLPVLNPAEYLALERQYRQIMSAAGLPEGFYDSYDDFTGWISGDVSPAEIQERVSLASTALYSSDSYYLQTLKSYGLGDGDLVAYMLDQNKALPLLQKQVRAAQVGAEAARNSLGITQQRAEYFADLGVSAEQARGAYQMIGENLPAAQKLGALGGESYGQTDLEDELLGGSGLASAKRKRLTTKEVSRFSGRSGVGDKAMARRSRAEY